MKEAKERGINGDNELKKADCLGLERGLRKASEVKAAVMHYSFGEMRIEE